MVDEKIISKQSGALLEVFINRPQNRNALDDEMYGQLSKLFSHAAENNAIKGLLISGIGDHFCAGNDLNDFANWPEMARSGQELPVTQLMKQIITFPKPIIASIRGATVGIGATLLLHCDMVIGSKSTRIIYPFTSLGLVPEFASTLLLPERIGQSRARQILLLGEAIDGEEAYRLGIISTLCDDDTLTDFTQRKCEQINKLPAYSLQYSKQLIQTPERQQLLLQQVEKETALFLQCLDKEAHKEAIKQFFLKPS